MVWRLAVWLSGCLVVWPSGSLHSSSGYKQYLQAAVAVWAPSEVAAVTLAAITGRHVWAVPFLLGLSPYAGVHRSSSGTPPSQRPVLCFGNMSPRRRLLVDLLTARGAPVEVVDAVHGRQLDRVIAASALLFSSTVYTGRTFPSYMRIAMALNNRVPIVLEQGEQHELDSFAHMVHRIGGVSFAPVHHVVDVALGVLNGTGAGVMTPDVSRRWDAFQERLFDWDGSFPALQALVHS
jgi:hypothetical protein